MITLGIDLGGTKIAFGLMQDDKLLAERIVKVPVDSSPSSIISLITETAESIQNEHHPFQAAGIGVPGQIEKNTGFIFKLPNLSNWIDVPLASDLAKALRVPVRVTNDVRASTLGEWCRGAGRGVDNLINVYLGTGIGGGLVVNGQLVDGEDNFAGEIGHIKVNFSNDGPICGCGQRNCMEAYAGGRGIENRFFSRAKLSNPALSRDDVTGHSILALAEGGDKGALDCLNETGLYLARGVQSLINSINPGLLLIGGGASSLFPFYRAVFFKELEQMSIPSSLKGLKVKECELGTRAGIYGACVLARQALQE